MAKKRTPKTFRRKTLRKPKMTPKRKRDANRAIVSIIFAAMHDPETQDILQDEFAPHEMEYICGAIDRFLRDLQGIEYVED